MKQKKKVLVALSGGVDSSVAAYLLAKEGYDIVGVMMQYWSEERCEQDSSGTYPTNKCCSAESLLTARKVAHELGAPFYVLDFRKAFKKCVVDPFLESHKEGKTPNPCIECNRSIKFGKLFEKMKELECDFLATGHYVQKKEGHIFASPNQEKDQSYFLYRLKQEQIRHLLFPVGGYDKSKVFQFAKQFGLEEFAKKPESQGVCFFPENSPEPFLRRNAPSLFTPGDIVTKEGEVLGQHEGLPTFTIGQRRGIGIGGAHDPWMVVGFHHSKNQLIVGKNSDLFTQSFTLSDISWIAGVAPNNKSLLVKIRHLGTLYKIENLKEKNQILEVKLSESVRAVTPGQSAVFYSEEGEILGGGVISFPFS